MSNKLREIDFSSYYLKTPSQVERTDNPFNPSATTLPKEEALDQYGRVNSIKKFNLL